MVKNFLFEGTLEERGITSWQNIPSKTQEAEELVAQDFKEGIDVYDPIFPKKWRNSRILKYIPFLPDPEDKEQNTDIVIDKGNISQENEIENTKV